MKSNIKKKSGYISYICLILLIFMSMQIGQASVSAERTIEKNVLTAGSGTSVTVFIQNDNTTPLGLLKESIPPGWSLTRISDDARSFKAGEWIWSPTVGNNSDKTVKYIINVPSGTTPGTYIINGNVTAGLDITTKVTGDSTIEVTSGSSGSSGGSGSSDNPTAPTLKKNDINVTGTPTVVTTVTMAKQPVAAPVETIKGISVATANKSPGFGIMIAIGIIVTIYILRRK